MNSYTDTSPRSGSFTIDPPKVIEPGQRGNPFKRAGDGLAFNAFLNIAFFVTGFLVGATFS